jgi:dTDP-4-amino-4,6-dideoxygalactose transaminase
MTNQLPLPLLRPRLPSAQELLPYLERIDANAFYTNFGPLNKLLLDRLTQWQQMQFGRVVYGVTTANATLGIELVLTDLKLPPGSRILLPALTFIATATAIIRCGHVPVVADVDAETWLLTPESLPKGPDLESLGAVVPVAAFGMPQNMNAWRTWSERTGVPVIVDAAAAFGAQSSQRNIPIIFSLHATKSLSTGEGGLILTEDPEQAQRLAQMTNFGIGPLSTVGASNAKMSEYHAAVGHAGFDAWPESQERRLRLHSGYQKILRQACGSSIRFQRDVGLVAPSSMMVCFDEPSFRMAAERICEEQGIQTRRWYQPLVHQHPAVSGVQAPFQMPQASELAKRLLGLPFHLSMDQKDVDRVGAALQKAISVKKLKNS